MNIFKKQNLLEFAERFKTDLDCKEYLGQIKWKNGYSCRKCGNFTSNKSSIIELCEWFGSTTLKGNPFNKAGRIDLKVGLNHTSTYTDTMLFKWNSTKQKMYKSVLNEV